MSHGWCMEIPVLKLLSRGLFRLMVALGFVLVAAIAAGQPEVMGETRPAESACEQGRARSEPPTAAETCRPRLNHVAGLGRRGDLDAGLRSGSVGFRPGSEPTESSLPATASKPATGPAPLLSAPAIERIPLPIPGRDGHAFYVLRKPAGYGPGQMPPLIIALHGTDDTAAQMVDFWGARNMRISPLIAAPQGVGPGWRDSDTAMIQTMFEHLQANVSYDTQRVLLAGFSAGGAMSFQFLYVEKAPVTAVAALANYVPPWITSEQVKARAHVPVFYAVGMADINHERMREGLQRLRAAGARVDLDRPRIGHVLDSDVAQEALDWFFDRCADHISAALDRMTAARLVTDLPALDRICLQRPWHEAAHVRRAERLIEDLEAPGRLELVKARAFAAESRPADAVEVLQEIESRFIAGPLAREARGLRLHLESDPAVRREIADRLASRRAEQALSLYASAQRLVVQRQFDEAAEQCRRVIDLYGETPGAERARTLLQLLENRKQP